MKVIADDKQIATMIDRLAEEFSAVVAASEEPWAIVGIRSRGDVLAQRLGERVKVPHSGSVDIALYRDDLSEVGPQPIVRTTDIDFDLDGVNVLLVDDVLMTGRSVRAAIQSLIDFGRPRKIKLMVLVDRGGRELPITPDFVGQRVNTEPQQLVEVRIKPTDPDDEVVMFKRPRRSEGRA